MKTIAYMDRTENKTLHYYFENPDTPLFFNRQKRLERINKALKELKHMGYIKVFLIDGNKTRFLFAKSN